MVPSIIEECGRNHLSSYFLQKKRLEYYLYPQHKVDLIDMFKGQSEEGYGEGV